MGGKWLPSLLNTLKNYLLGLPVASASDVSHVRRLLLSSDMMFVALLYLSSCEKKQQRGCVSLTVSRKPMTHVTQLNAREDPQQRPQRLQTQPAPWYMLCSHRA